MYILIVLIFGSYGSTHMSTQEFNSQKACEKTVSDIQTLSENIQASRDVIAFCAYKGSQWDQ